MTMKKHVPNTITCCNLISGCIATYFAFQANFQLAFAFIIIGAVFDFFDGFAARLLHVSSPVGKELDSLADDITFGFAPAAIVFSMLRALLTACGSCAAACPVTPYVPYVAFVIAAFSALRLAKFNLDERQTTSFIGLPTPANALFWSALAYKLHCSDLLGESWMLAILLAGVLLSCWLLVAEIPMFALKFKSYALRDNKLRYGFMLFSIVMLWVLAVWAIPVIILSYIVCSLVNNAVTESKNI